MEKIDGVVDDNNIILLLLSEKWIVSTDFRDRKKKCYFQTELSATVRLSVPCLFQSVPEQKIVRI